MSVYELCQLAAGFGAVGFLWRISGSLATLKYIVKDHEGRIKHLENWQ